MKTIKMVGSLLIMCFAVLFFTSIGHGANQWPNMINEAGKTHSPKNESVDNAIDGNHGSKFLNFEGKHGESGFYLGFSCKVNLDTIVFETANDSHGRDPSYIDVYGCYNMSETIP